MSVFGCRIYLDFSGVCQSCRRRGTDWFVRRRRSLTLCWREHLELPCCLCFSCCGMAENQRLWRWPGSPRLRSLCFALFLAMISFCFSRIGKARKAVEGDRAKEWYFWFLGAALFANVVGFFGVSYFDQTKVMWFALLAVICTATSSILGVKELAEQ